MLILVCTAQSAVQTAAAQPFDAFAGRINPDSGFVCDPNGSVDAIATCAGLYLRTEQAALDRVIDRWLAKARTADVGPMVYLDIGYWDSFQRAQGAWTRWRDQECRLATIDAVAGPSRRISYLECLGNMTAQRRKQLTDLLALWNNNFRVAGQSVGTGGFFPRGPAQ